ncbi:GFA family protein [Sphingomonas soli]|uniref:GFA family protein n=1 Tax=Sphingomonas soli TaxID=266127 RepID=UPI000835A732|nr:GFA family protein [Sphingomonas soli]
MLTGGCLCGAVRYSADLPDPPVTYACHCTDCQTQSGASFALQLPVALDALTISGEMISASHVTPSGGTSTHFYCAKCLVRIYNINTRRPGFGVLRAGTLDDSAGIIPRAHIYIKSKQPWVGLPEGAITFETVPASDWFRILAEL